MQQFVILAACVVAVYNVDLSSQVKAARQQAEVSRQELTDYKEKAARILQVHSIDPPSLTTEPWKCTTFNLCGLQKGVSEQMKTNMYNCYNGMRTYGVCLVFFYAL